MLLGRCVFVCPVHVCWEVMLFLHKLYALLFGIYLHIDTVVRIDNLLLRNTPDHHELQQHTVYCQDKLQIYLKQLKLIDS